MKVIRAIALAGVAAALAGTAVAAAPDAARTHVMNVALPDGGVARIEYAGDIAPKVSVDPAPWAMAGTMPSFAGFDRMIEKMNRQTQAMMRQIHQAPIANGVPGMNVAAYGNLPAGANSVNVISVSNGGATCTRTTEVVSQGPGKAPKVTTNVSGRCGAAAAPAPGTATGPINPT